MDLTMDTHNFEAKIIYFGGSFSTANQRVREILKENRASSWTSVANCRNTLAKTNSLLSKVVLFFKQNISILAIHWAWGGLQGLLCRFFWESPAAPELRLVFALDHSSTLAAFSRKSDEGLDVWFGFTWGIKGISIFILFIFLYHIYIYNVFF